MDIRYKFCRKSFGTDAASQSSSQEFVVNLAENGLWKILEKMFICWTHWKTFSKFLLSEIFHTEKQMD